MCILNSLSYFFSLHTVFLVIASDEISSSLIHLVAFKTHSLTFSFPLLCFSFLKNEMKCAYNMSFLILPYSILLLWFLFHILLSQHILYNDFTVSFRRVLLLKFFEYCYFFLLCLFQRYTYLGIIYFLTLKEMFLFPFWKPMHLGS